jgi:hypothetical protein
MRPEQRNINAAESFLLDVTSIFVVSNKFSEIPRQIPFLTTCEIPVLRISNHSKALSSDKTPRSFSLHFIADLHGQQILRLCHRIRGIILPCRAVLYRLNGNEVQHFGCPRNCK